MEKEQFESSMHLVKAMGEAKLDSGKTLKEELFLGQKISLWDVVATYLVLYRFPLLFSANGRQAASQSRLKYYYRPLRGLAAHFRDYVVLPPRRSTGCTEWPEGNHTVLFISFVPVFYRDVLQPVAESLTAIKGLNAVVIGQDQNSAINADVNKRLRFHSIWEHWDNGAERITKSLLKHLKILKKTLFNKAQVAMLTHSVKDSHAEPALRGEFYWLFWREFKRLIVQVAAARHILEQHRPALIISADDADPRCRIYSLLARAAGIPSLLVQQGFSTKDYPEWSFFSHDAVAAMGQSSREDMIAQGVPAEKIIVTGHPGFDNLASSEPEVCARVRCNLGIPNEQKMVLFASQPYYVGVFNAPDMRRKMIQAIIEATRTLDNIKLVVKPHPGESVREIEALIGKAQHVVMVDKVMDISILIKACDVLITLFSQSGLQALYAGKPVINVDFPGSGGNSLYLKSNATWVARSKDEIAVHIRKLTGADRDGEMAVRETARRQFLNEMVYLPDGHATERILQIISNMLH